jgi:hypothetical protein
MVWKYNRKFPSIFIKLLSIKFNHDPVNRYAANARIQTGRRTVFLYKMLLFLASSKERLELRIILLLWFDGETFCWTQGAVRLVSTQGVGDA